MIRERTQAEDQIEDAARLEQGGTGNGKVIQVVKKKQDVIDSHKVAEDITKMMQRVAKTENHKLAKDITKMMQRVTETENQNLAEDITKTMRRVTETENQKLAEDITKMMKRVTETENHKLAADGVTEVAKGVKDARIAGEGPTRVPDVTKGSHKPQTVT